MVYFVAVQARQNGDLIEQNFRITETLEQLMSMVESLATQNKTLETRISQLICSPPGLNPKGHVNTFTTRKGKDIEIHKEVEISNDEENIGFEKKLTTPPKKKVVKEVEGEMPYVSPPPCKPLIPFPQKFKKA